MTQWYETKNKLPTEGEVVLTMSPGGMEQELIRKGNLWFHSDMVCTSIILLFAGSTSDE